MGRLRTEEARRLLRYLSERARAGELELLGFTGFDALHLACAESAAAAVFLTTDDKLLKGAARLADDIRVQVANPLEWLRRRS
jgi:predicted nucleic acid-binding protein